MIRVKLGEHKFNREFFVLLIWLLVFQSPLELVHPIFKYIDEMVALLGVLYGVILVFQKGKVKLSKDTYNIVVSLIAFVAVGLLSNILYCYQVIEAVFIDVFTNLKFFLAISAGYYFVVDMCYEQIHQTASKNARVITIILFCFFLVDRVFNIYPADIRYGIRSVKLFFLHPTYLAGAIGFLLILMTIFYEKKILST